MQRVREVELRIERHVEDHGQGAAPTREELEGLAVELETVWNSPEANVRLKKRIVRTLIQEVVVDVDGQAGEVILFIHWKGGVHTELRLPRRRRGESRYETSPSIVEAVRVLARICPDDLLANALNRNGLRTGHGNRWTRQRVASLRSDHRIACYTSERRTAEGWMNLTEASAFLGLSPRALRLAVERGEIKAEHPLPDGPWVFQRQALETEAATNLVGRVRRTDPAPSIPRSEQGDLGFSTT